MSYTYDKADRLLSVTDPESVVTNYKYDVLDRKTKVVEAANADQWRETDTVYDAADNMVAQVDRRGQTTTYTYDGLNRQTGAIYPDDDDGNA